MKNWTTKRKVSLSVISIITLFALYIGFGIYQTKRMEILPFEAIEHVEVSGTNELTADTQITGTATLDNFEAIGIVDQMVVGDTLYLLIYKWPALMKDNQIAVTLDQTENVTQLKQISVVYGEIFTGEGASRGINLNDLVTHPQQKVIWEKEGGGHYD